MSGFATHTRNVDGLPEPERAKLKALARWVVETHIPGDFPVTGIEIVGHCDHDQRGKAFEDGISHDRAAAVRAYLESEIYWQSPGKFVVIPGQKPILDKITFRHSGVGSKNAKPASSNAQRLRNRQVEIFFDRGPKTLPDSELADNIIKATEKYIRETMPALPPDLRPKFFDEVKPIPTKSDFKKLIEWFRKTPLIYVDFKTIGSSLTDLLSAPSNNAEHREKWIEDFADAAIEEERERLKRTNDPPGDPEPDPLND